MKIEKVIQSKEGFAQNGRVYGVGGVSHFVSRHEAVSVNLGLICSLVPPTLGTGHTMSEVKIMIKEATQKGFAEAKPGDSVNLQFPDSETRRGRVGEGIANTLQCNDGQGTVAEDLRIRKLTPKECFRLQGWTDDYFEKAAFVNTDSQLYKQAGNGVTVNVIKEIARYLK